MTIGFFVRQGDLAPLEGDPLPSGLSWQTWQPRGLPAPVGLPVDPWRLAVWLQDRCGLFADGRYLELSITSGKRRVCRLVVTPRWYRFPFMAPDDLQLGALWTDPAWRRQGLARRTMAEAHRRFAGATQRFWYVTDSGNAASVALARASGYRPAGEGHRTRPVGIGLIGRYEIERATFIYP